MPLLGIDRIKNFSQKRSQISRNIFKLLIAESYKQFFLFEK